MGWTRGAIRVQFLVGARNLSFCHHLETSSGAHPASYQMGTGVWIWPLTSI